MNSSDSFRKYGPNFQDFEFRAETTMFILLDAVGDDNPVQSGGVDAINGVAAEDSVCKKCVDVGCTFFFEELGGTCDGVGCVC